MVNLKNISKTLSFVVCVSFSIKISAIPLENPLVQNLHNESQILNQQTTAKINNHHNVNKDGKFMQNSSDSAMAASDYKRPQLHLPVVIKPRGFHLPKQRPAAQQKQKEPQQPAAQNYYSHYFPDLPPLGHAQPYYPFTEDSIISKFLSQQNKPFEPQHQEHFSAYDATILGSGDFGILRGGTFYSDEEQPFHNEESSDFYYGDASNTHVVSSTEGFIQKYTYPEEQFAQFRDFADLGTPSDSAFSQYVVVYANKNSTTRTRGSANRHNAKPKNIFEQLQEIDKEKALEQKRVRKNQTSPSVTKLKLVKTKLMEKKWVQRQPLKSAEEDPLLALS